MIARSVLGAAAVTYTPAELIWELTAPETGLTQTTGASLL
jgi:hypothetical protein